MRFEALQQVLGRAVLLKFLPPQMSAHICYAELTRPHLRHQNAAELVGHKDLASTMIYLKAVRNKDVIARLNSSELAALAYAQ